MRDKKTLTHAFLWLCVGSTLNEGVRGRSNTCWKDSVDERLFITYRSQMSDFKSRVEVSTASYVSSGLLLNVNAMRQGPTGSGLARRVPVALDTRLCMFSKHQEIFSFYKLQLALRCLQQVMP